MLGLVLLYIISLVAGCTSAPATTHPTQLPTLPIVKTQPVSTSQKIIAENALPGTTSWQIPMKNISYTDIQAYASATSVLAGQPLTFYVSTKTQGMPYAISIYRIGWYGGTGGRLMKTIRNLAGMAQGYYDVGPQKLFACATCEISKASGLVEANWHPSYTLTLPTDWISGVYLARFTDANNMQTYVPFNVKDESSSAYVVVTADTTAAAYNNWGGNSLYDYNSQETTTQGRASKVSLDRPYVDAAGSGYVLQFEADTIHWMERQGYDVSYLSDVDIHENPAQLLRHRVYISVGHDEYWTKEMRDGVEAARNHGVSLAFLEADAVYWQMRFEPDSHGQQDRTIVCYKVNSSLHDLARDPFYGKDNTRVTTLWRDPLLDRPENALIGIMYSDLNQHYRGFPWVVSAQASSPLLQGTGLQPGSSYGCDLVGYEWDRIFDNGATPKGLQVLGLSYTVNDTKESGTSNTTYYFAPSGAMVFATGSIYWTAALDAYRFSKDKLCPGVNNVIPEMQKLMTNVMKALLIRSVNIS